MARQIAEVKRNPRRPERGATRDFVSGLAAKLDKLNVDEAPPAQAPVWSEDPAVPDEDLEAEEWTATLPEPTEAERAALAANSLSARDVDDADLDRAWDWLRAEDDKGARFLGMVPQTSKEMRDRLAMFGEHLYALVESSEAGDAHVGFAGLFPITGDFASMHLFLAVEARGRIASLVPQLMTMVANTYPLVPKFVVHTKEAALARLYRPFGFTTQYLLTWTPPAPPAEPV